MKALARLIGKFAAMLDPDPANEDKLLEWIAGARAADLPHLHSFTRGLDLDIQAATAALTLPHHNGGSVSLTVFPAVLVSRFRRTGSGRRR